ncbi:MAG: ABC transporter permease subunit, partial [Bdellovibrionales bacterium]|nr:ABC transporter permease subunit [Bdellovibrionales bacterium]
MTFGSILGMTTVALIAATIGIDLIVGSGPLKNWFLIATFSSLTLGFFVVVIRNGLVPYVFKRLLEAAGVMFLIVTATFVLLRYLPGGPFDSEKALPPEIKANIEAKYNLNAPLHQQYLDYLKKLSHGDMGVSYKYIGRPVTEMITSTIPNSFQLGFYALIVSFCLGIPMGVFAANRHNTWADTLTMTTAMSGVALPSFLVAPILILIFSYWLDILPPALWEGPIYYILPVVTLGIRPAAIIARLTRSSVLDV